MPVRGSRTCCRLICAFDADHPPPDWAFGRTARRKSVRTLWHATDWKDSGLTRTSSGDPRGRRGSRLLGGNAKNVVGTYRSIVPYRRGQRLEIDEATRRSLEMTRTMRDGQRDGSLLAGDRRTVTSMGSRMLADWLANPLTDFGVDQRRLTRSKNCWRTEYSARTAIANCGASMTWNDCSHGSQRGGPVRETCVSSAHAGQTAKDQGETDGSAKSLLHQLEAELDLCPDLRRSWKRR